MYEPIRHVNLKQHFQQPLFQALIHNFLSPDWRGTNFGSR